MNGLTIKRSALQIALLPVLASTHLSAELISLGDQELSHVRGQAGLSIELSTNIEIGEIAYKDQGFLVINNLELGGIGGSALDNLLITVDSAGSGEVLHRGFSKVAQWANQGLVSASNADVADAMAKYSQGGEYGEAFNDGDLVIHIDALNPNVNSGNNSDQNLTAYQQAVDFELSLDSIDLNPSTYAIGSNAAGSHMFSNINMQGYLGPIDIIIRNGSGATQTVSNGSMEVSDSVVELDAYFRVTDLDLTWDAADVLLIFNFAALTQYDVQIHNTRGNDSVGSFGFAHVGAKIAEGTSTLNGVTGLALYDVEIRADIDMPHFEFGNAGSIGEVYMTDFVFKTDVLVYGH